MNLKKSVVKLSILFTSLFIILTLSSFVGYSDLTETPGTIKFIGDAGSPNEFVFTKWQFTKFNMPNEQVEKIQLEVEINTSSLTTDWKDLEKSIRKKKDYFYVKKFPKAYITINGATLQEDGRYTTSSTLSLKGISKEVPLQFTISKEKPYVVEGSGVIKRRKFNFTGDGPKNEVPISFKVILPER